MHLIHQAHRDKALVSRLIDLTRTYHVPFRGTTHPSSLDWGVYIHHTADNAPFLVLPSIQIPPLDYRRKFDADLQTAAFLSEDRWESMELTAAPKSGKRRMWLGICSMFIENGQVVRLRRKLAGILPQTPIDNFLCTFSANTKNYASWRATVAKGQHLIKHSENCYSLAW